MIDITAIWNKVSDPTDRMLEKNIWLWVQILSKLQTPGQLFLAIWNKYLSECAFNAFCVSTIIWQLRNLEFNPTYKVSP